MPYNITVEEIASLLRLLNHYHSAHEAQYGILESCTEPTCIEAKMAVEHLIDSAATRSVKPVESSRKPPRPELPQEPKTHTRR